MTRRGKKITTVRRTVVVLLYDDVPISTRALDWEDNARSSMRKIHRIERAAPGDYSENIGEVYLIDMELTCKGANRSDLTKFVRTYLRECEFFYITE